MSRRSSIGSKATRRSTQSRVGRHLHLDVFSGIAGNMFLGALLDLGLSRRALDAELAGLNLDYRLRVSTVRRGAIAARYVQVLGPKSNSKKSRAHDAEHSHFAHGRSYREIRATLKRATLRDSIRSRALEIFEQLAQAEAKVHGVKPEVVHFHEVGAVDAIVDIVAAAAGLELLGVCRVTCSPVALGHGAVNTEHGMLPLPAPATLELLRGVPTVPAQVAWETVTPTGAAILRCIVDEFLPLPAMTPESVGYGAGDDRVGPMPNVLRAILGKQIELEHDRVVCLETNLDDLSPEHFEYLMERLLENGALDVSVQSLQMKKNRPGFLVRILAQPKDRILLAQILFAESTAIGVRYLEMDRLLLKREIVALDTVYGKIRVKKIMTQQGVECSAEYEDCKRAARKTGVPLREVVRNVELLARREWS